MSNIFAYDMDRQSVVDKMVRQISLEVMEQPGNLFSMPAAVSEIRVGQRSICDI